MIVWRINGERTAPPKYDSSHPRRSVLDQLAESTWRWLCFCWSKLLRTVLSLVQTPKFESIKASWFKSHCRCYFSILKMWGISAIKKAVGAIQWWRECLIIKKDFFSYLSFKIFLFFITISLICVHYSRSIINIKEIISSPKRLYHSQPLESLERATTIFYIKPFASAFSSDEWSNHEVMPRKAVFDISSFPDSTDLNSPG